MLIGFFSKQFVLYSAINNGYYFISIIAILVSVISASYYLKIIRVLHDINVNSSFNFFWGKEKIKIYSLQNSNFSIFSFRKKLLEMYANLNLKLNNNQNIFHTNYFKEIQLIFILFFIFKFDLISKRILNNNLNSSINLRNLTTSSTKDNYLNKELWQINTSIFESLPLIKFKNTEKSHIFNNYKEFNLINIINSGFFYQLSNFHSFLISNLTIIILLFVLKPAKHNRKMLWWVKLSNSGELLKLLIPNFNWKTKSGWTNYSCMVTSQKISEKLIENCGSKSELKLNSVKEQRVDGSWWIKPIHLRYTLMGFERNYQIKIPSKQLNLNNKYFSTFKKQSNFLNPWFTTGLIDAEGSFSISIYKSNEHKLHWGVRTVFVIDLHERELNLLLEIQKYFGGIGSINKSNNRKSVSYSVAGIPELKKIIIPHFENYPLLTQKAADFLLFKQVVELIINKEHLTIEGLTRIVNIKASMNFGLSENIKLNFKKINPVERKIINTIKIPDLNWLAGFTTGEGNFILVYLNQKI